MPWGGGRYTVGIDASRATTNNPTNPFNPQLDSSLAASYTQPLLRNFRMDGARQNLLQSQKGQEIADVQLRQTLTQTSRSVRNAYFNLVNAIGQLQVANKSLELAQTSLRNNNKKVELGTIAADRHRAGGSRSRTNRGAGHRGRGSDPVGGGRPARAHHEPLAAGFLDDQAGTGRAADARAAAVERRRRHRQRAANRTDLLQTRKQMEQTDITMKYLRNQKLPAVDVIGNYNVQGVAGTQFQFDRNSATFPPPILAQSQRSFNDALRDVFANDFKTWSVGVQPDLPDRDQRRRRRAGAGAPAARPADDESTRSGNHRRGRRSAMPRGRSRPRSSGSRRHRKPAQLAEQNLQAYEKRLAVGLSDTFLVIQAQRDLTGQLNNELAAIIAYNRALINFEAVQVVPPGGGF